MSTTNDNPTPPASDTPTPRQRLQAVVDDLNNTSPECLSALDAIRIIDLETELAAAKNDAYNYEQGFHIHSIRADEAEKRLTAANACIAQMREALEEINNHPDEEAGEWVDIRDKRITEQDAEIARYRSVVKFQDTGFIEFQVENDAIRKDRDILRAENAKLQSAVEYWKSCWNKQSERLDAELSENAKLRSLLQPVSTPSPEFDIWKLAKRPADEVVFVALKCGHLNAIRAALAGKEQV